MLGSRVVRRRTAGASVGSVIQAFRKSDRSDDTPVGLATHVFGTSRLHRTPRDPYTVGKSAVGSFQHCARPPHTRARTGDTRTDTRALPACQRCRRVPQARASATHTHLLLHTVETSAPAASRRYADVAQRPTLARVVKILPHRMRVLAPARQILPAPAPDAPRTYPRSSLQPIAAPGCAAQPPCRCLQARCTMQPHTSRAQTHERDGTHTP